VRHREKRTDPDLSHDQEAMTLSILRRRVTGMSSALALASCLLAVQPAGADQATGAPSLAEAQRLLYNGAYAEAAELARGLRSADGVDLAAYELLTSALHFQIREAMGKAADRIKAGDRNDKNKVLAACAECPALLAAFKEETARSLTLARARLTANAQDDAARFFLGKLNLNHVWLHLGTLGRRTAWSEYREARRSMEAVLKRHPAHVRARVAHAWIEYIVDTRVPFGFQWMLGGGDRRKALATVKAAAGEDAEFFVRTEARFALWEMQIREKLFADALVTARTLLVDFPGNRDLVKFVEAHK
jgi:hypothetical protein